MFPSSSLETPPAGPAGVSFHHMFPLVVFLGAFVVGDLTTTVWLINHDPVGITNEGNPFAAGLYLRYGVMGLILGKLFLFSVLSATYIVFASRAQFAAWMREAFESTLLAMIAYSLFIVYNNYLAITTLILRSLSLRASLEGLPVLRYGIPALTILVVEIIILRFMKANRVVHGSGLGTTVALLAPLVAYEKAFIALLSSQPFLFVAYVIAILTLAGAFTYMIEQIRRQRALVKTDALKKGT